MVMIFFSVPYDIQNYGTYTEKYRCLYGGSYLCY